MLRNGRSLQLICRCTQSLETVAELTSSSNGLCIWDPTGGKNLRKLSSVDAPSSHPSSKIQKTEPLVLQVLPKRFIWFAHLMRWDKPSPAWLLAWPCFWSISLAAPCGSLPDVHTLALFGFGAWVMRGAGCTINDMWDHNIDKKVERTRNRPLASGSLRMADAWVLLAGQLSVGLAVLLQLNDFSKLLGASSLALVATYPLMKRVTFWPQVVLGATFNWGALLGYAAVKGSCDPAIVIPLYAAGIAWTVVYDTIYACQDIKDDEKLGLKSTAIRFKKNLKPWLAGFSAAMVSGLGLVGVAADCGLPYYTGVLGVAAHLGWQISHLDPHNSSDCSAKFASNKWLGAVLFASIMSDKLLCGPSILVNLPI